MCFTSFFPSFYFHIVLFFSFLFIIPDNVITAEQTHSHKNEHTTYYPTFFGWGAFMLWVSETQQCENGKKYGFGAVFICCYLKSSEKLSSTRHWIIFISSYVFFAFIQKCLVVTSKRGFEHSFIIIIINGSHFHALFCYVSSFLLSYSTSSPKNQHYHRHHRHHCEIVNYDKHCVTPKKKEMKYSIFWVYMSSFMDRPQKCE